MLRDRSCRPTRRRGLMWNRLDASMAQHLAAVLRRSASQVWLSTRRPQAAEVFLPSELIRLTRQKAGSRSVHYGQTPKTKKELLAARHWHLQLLPAVASRSVVGIEGPHDRAALTSLAKRLHEQEAVELPAANRLTFVDAAAADGAGGSRERPRPPSGRGESCWSDRASHPGTGCSS